MTFEDPPSRDPELVATARATMIGSDGGDFAGRIELGLAKELFPRPPGTPGSHMGGAPETISILANGFAEDLYDDAISDFRERYPHLNQPVRRELVEPRDGPDSESQLVGTGDIDLARTVFWIDHRYGGRDEKGRIYGNRGALPSLCRRIRGELYR